MKLRKENKLEESNTLLLELVAKSPQDAYLNYQCAWSFDVLGLESQAVPYYEAAIALGLSGSDLEGAYLGLGSTYRTIADYNNSKRIFEQGMEQFPNNKVLPVFYAMTLYNLQEHDRAMEVLLLKLIETTSDEGILGYSKAIQFYSNQLDRVWD
ncbi:tetratricopeptide repeat protein [Paenibacillus sp. N1-5-1-14]|uniref:tetratricopeptide repeat protein n=1 Tax=Paenibacillus radicibacter TaxID=2972488 RepID=UPI002158D1BF|nr:tetratricopeptide repeat protein [Paenibacillus radicibacter]MCR8645209.1 tetratricopeptide repeat protein [Paenibacillus radicibacter]